MSLIKQKPYEDRQIDLNVNNARKRKKKYYWIFFMFSFVAVLIIIWQLSSYCNYVGRTGIISNFPGMVKTVLKNGLFKFDYLKGPATLHTTLWIFIIYGLAMALLYLDDVRHTHDLSGRESGSAQFNDNVPGFMQKYAEQDSTQNILLSRNVAMSLNTRKTMRNLNNLVIGGAGTGKSRFVVKPNILQANCNFVVTDPSGELLESTGTFLKDKCNYKIKVFNLVEFDKSFSYNPFRYIRDEAGVLMMIDCLFKNTTPPDQKGEKFWEDAEKSLMLALCFFLWQHMPVEQQNFDTVMQLLRLSDVDEYNPDAESPLDMIFLKPQLTKARKGKKGPTMNGKPLGDTETERIIDATTKDYLARVRNKDGSSANNLQWRSLEELYPDGTDIAVNQYKTFKKGAGKTAKSILISCMVRLNAFNIPQIQRLTNTDTIDLRGLAGLGSDKKQALFVIIPAADSTYNFLVSMMYSQLFETMYHIAETECKGKSLPVDLRFLLDEFSNIGTIPEFPKKLATMRKYRISCTIILQNLAQIKTLYEDDWETLVGNCDTLTYLGSNEYTTLEYISNLLGEQTIIGKDRSMAPGRKGGDSQSYKTMQRKLMTPDELRNIPNKDCIVIIRGHDPFYDLKYDYLQHQNYGETGDADEKLLYKLPVITGSYTVDEISREAHKLRSVEAQTVRKTTIDEVIEDNPDWGEYPDIYAQFRAILFQSRAEEERLQAETTKTEAIETSPEGNVPHQAAQTKGDNEPVLESAEAEAMPDMDVPEETSEPIDIPSDVQVKAGPPVLETVKITIGVQAVKQQIPAVANTPLKSDTSSKKPPLIAATFSGYFDDEA